MKLESQVVSLGLAKKLKELGVKQESLFYWTENGQLVTTDQYDDFLEWVDTVGKPADFSVEKHYAAFTVAELGEMFPGNDGENYYMTNKGMMGRLWYCSLVNMVTDKAVYTEEADTEADARAKMLIYLLENNLITL